MEEIKDKGVSDKVSELQTYYSDTFSATALSFGLWWRTLTLSVPNGSGTIYFLWHLLIKFPFTDITTELQNSMKPNIIIFHHVN